MGLGSDHRRPEYFTCTYQMSKTKLAISGLGKKWTAAIAGRHVGHQKAHDALVGSRRLIIIIGGT
jgi:hypothetical protein